MKFKETLIGRIPIHWEVMTLKECTEKITDGTHSTVKDNPEGEYYLLSCKNIKDGNILLGSNERRIDYETLMKLRKRTDLKKDDILLTTVGTIGESAIIEEEIIDYEFQRSVAIIRCNTETILPRFMYYLTKSKKFLAQADGRVSGSVQKCLFLSGISEISIPLPPINEQIKIICILDSIENKLKINNEMNKTLEEMAQALFKRWFVDFEFPNEEGKPYKSSGGEMVESEMGMIPKGWNIEKTAKIVEVTDYVANGSFAALKQNVTTSEEEDYAILIRLVDYNRDFNGPFMYVDKKGYEFLSKSKLFGGEIIISNVGANAGTVFKVPKMKKPMTLGPNSIMLIPNVYTNYLYLFFTSSNGQEQLKSILSGSAQPKFNKTEFRNLKCINPSLNIINKFNIIMAPMIDMNEKLREENSTLIKLRDLLLPKLMSGEINIKDMEANL